MIKKLYGVVNDWKGRENEGEMLDYWSVVIFYDDIFDLIYKNLEFL